MTASTSVIEVSGLRMRYGSKDVLDGVDLVVRRGEVVALLGPNGAGKTTTIEILEGFRVRSGGAVSVLGVDPVDAPEAWRARVGIVLQSWRDHARWTSRQLLDHLGRYFAPFSTPEHPRPYPLEDLLGMVGLTEFADQKIRTLSGGQRRRLDLAVGIIGRPEVLFLDEPTAGFDPQARREFHDLVHRLSADEAVTVLLTTHDLDEAERLADRILVLAGGRIVANGAAEELALRVTREATVRWTEDGRRHEHRTPQATEFVRGLLAERPTLTDLEVRRATLEDTYLALVHRYESGAGDAAAVSTTPFEEASS